MALERRVPPAGAMRLSFISQAGGGHPDHGWAGRERLDLTGAVESATAKSLRERVSAVCWGPSSPTSGATPVLLLGCSGDPRVEDSAEHQTRKAASLGGHFKQMYK